MAIADAAIKGSGDVASAPLPLGVCWAVWAILSAGLWFVVASLALSVF